MVLSDVLDSPRRRFGILLFLLALYLFGFGSRGLNEPDEGRYANISLEMLEPGADWGDPQLADVGHYDKPPMIYWLCAFSIKTFGRNEWAARLPSLLGWMMTMAGLFWASRRLYPSLNAWMLLLMAGSTLHLWLCSRLLSPDMLLTGLTTLAIAAWAETRHREKAWPFHLLQVLFWALAFLTKATPALIPFAGLSLYVLLSRDAGMHYLDDAPLQIEGDRLHAEEHFIHKPDVSTPLEFPADAWLVDLHRDRMSHPFPPEWFDEEHIVKVGDFDLIPIRPTIELNHE